MSRRVQSVDALRGLVMIIMALDHTRDFFHYAATQFQPEDLTRTTPAIFFTRWITHFCAPAFMFTAGLGAWFWFSRGRTKAQLSAYLVKRGLWLIFLELTVVRLAMTFGEGIFLITVLWGLGLSMIVLALLVHLPIRILAPFSIAVIALHNLTDPISAEQFGKASWIWSLLHTLAPFNIGSITVRFSYPLIPWFAVMALGFCFGQLFTLEPAIRQKQMIRIGLATSIAFVALRFLNVYGDPFTWSGGLLSFLRVNKYPPSLDFVLMTLGPAILLLAVFEKIKFSSLNPLMVFGRTPLFYFLAHLAIIHLLTLPFAWIRYGKWVMINPVLRIYPQGYGYPLWFVYVLWFAIVASLYPICLWYSRLRAARSVAGVESGSGIPPLTRRLGIFKNMAARPFAALAMIAVATAQSIPPGEIRSKTTAYEPPSPTALRAEVRVVEVPVVVRDSRHHAVAGLTQDDFTLSDDGKKQTITAFSVQSAQASADQNRPRFLAFLFDNLHLDAGHLKSIKDAAERFVETSLAPGERVAIVTTGQSQKSVFTSDVETLTGQIAAIAPAAARIMGEVAQCPHLSSYEAYLVVNRLDGGRTLSEKTIECAACHHLPPGQSCNESEVAGIAQSVLQRTRSTSAGTLTVIDSLVDGMAKAPGQRVVVLTSSGFFIGALESDVDRLMDEARHGQVTISALDASGLRLDLSDEGRL